MANTAFDELTIKVYRAQVDRIMKEYDYRDRPCIELERVEAATLAELPEYLASPDDFIRGIAEDKLEQFQRIDFYTEANYYGEEPDGKGD